VNMDRGKARGWARNRSHSIGMLIDIEGLGLPVITARMVGVLWRVLNLEPAL